MAQPLKKASVLNQELIKRLESERYIDDSEIFEYRLSLKHIDQHTVDGASTWALYYACLRDDEKALSFFRKSIALQDPDFISNYLIFLKRLGRMREFFTALSNISGRYFAHKGILKEHLESSMLAGDIDGALAYSQRISNMGTDEEKLAHARFRDDLNIFLKRAKMSNEDFKRLASLSLDFIDRNNIRYLNTGVFCSSTEDINYFYMTVSIERISNVRKLSFDFVCEVVRQKRFDGKNFTAEIINGSKDMDNMLDINIEYIDSFYIAECDAIHLVTEAKSLDKLREFIYDLTPDLIELNEVDADPNQVIFNFNFSQSAKNEMRKSNG